jgi:very-short-patch-repair endonuclease
LPESPLPPEREGPGEGLSNDCQANKDKAYDRQPTARSRELRNNPTDAERKLWGALSKRQLSGIRFNRQVPIRPYICDFVARSAKLIVEVDGGQHAINAAADRARTRFLESHGYRVIRFWNNDVLANIDGVVETIARALRDRPSPGPSRSGGRGEE